MKFGIFACQQEFYPQLVEGVDEKYSRQAASGILGKPFWEKPEIYAGYAPADGRNPAFETRI